MVNAYTYADAALVEAKISGVEVAVDGHRPRRRTGRAARRRDRSVSGVYSFEARYNAGETLFYTPGAHQRGDCRSRQRDGAWRFTPLLGLRHISRVDLIIDADGTAWFLEANVLPGLDRDFVGSAVDRGVGPLARRGLSGTGAGGDRGQLAHSHFSTKAHVSRETCAFVVSLVELVETRACRDPLVELVETRARSRPRWSSLSRPAGRASSRPAGRARRDPGQPGDPSPSRPAPGISMPRRGDGTPAVPRGGDEPERQTLSHSLLVPPSEAVSKAPRAPSKASP